jgi:hypothetical protein
MLTINFVLAGLAVLTSIACTVFLLRSYAANGLRLLLWSGLCFVFLSLNNVLLFLDLVVFTEVDLRPYRLAAALVGLLFLLYGFIWEAE